VQLGKLRRSLWYLTQLAQLVSDGSEYAVEVQFRQIAYSKLRFQKDFRSNCESLAMGYSETTCSSLF